MLGVFYQNKKVKIRCIMWGKNKYPKGKLNGIKNRKWYGEKECYYFSYSGHKNPLSGEDIVANDIKWASEIKEVTNLATVLREKVSQLKSGRRVFNPFLQYSPWWSRSRMEVKSQVHTY